MNDKFGDRMKAYEAATSIRLMPRLPTLIRLDGRAFHSFTRGLERPFDSNFLDCMAETLLALMKETNARCGYTQSDEITLLLYSDRNDSQIWFGGKHSKIVSQSSALASVEFNRQVASKLSPEYYEKKPVFDSRCWQVPNKAEAANAFLWREQDAIKNSISMLAQSRFSDKELFKKNSNEKMAMLGGEWEKQSIHFKRGIYAQRRIVNRKFSFSELEKLPEKHEARLNSELTFDRSEVLLTGLPEFSLIKNKIEVAFKGENAI